MHTHNRLWNALVWGFYSLLTAAVLAMVYVVFQVDADMRAHPQPPRDPRLMIAHSRPALMDLMDQLETECYQQAGSWNGYRCQAQPQPQSERKVLIFIAHRD